MPKTIKMFTEDGKWIVDEGYKVSTFDTAFEAWGYIFLLKELRPNTPWMPLSLYPVRSLNPIPALKQKKILWREMP